MHTDVSSPQAHGAPGFLPWHRAYLLDLERELQAIDPSVALPYWRFDQAAPELFTPDFFGTSGPNGTVQFSAYEPVAVLGHRRRAGSHARPRNNWNPATQPGPTVITEAADAGPRDATYPAFARMEGNPHGTAHTRWDGFIRSIDDRGEGSALLPAPLQRGSALGKVAAAERPLRSGAGALLPAAIPAIRSVTICPTRCGHGMA